MGGHVPRRQERDGNVRCPVRRNFAEARDHLEVRVRLQDGYRELELDRDVASKWNNLRARSPDRDCPEVNNMRKLDLRAWVSVQGHCQILSQFATVDADGVVVVVP